MSLKYRPEIDGLRSIAIIAVILYHAEFVFSGFRLLKGGFIGVDVFFVISGYLITSIILRDMNEGNFSFAKFYERRARRILPALFAVILVSIPFSWMYMLPKAVKEYTGSILTTLVSSSNIWFWREESYWAESSALKPFLHTWSLSVEEQFYLIFPITLLLLWKFLRSYITPVLTLVLLLSLQLVHFGNSHFPGATFFLLPTRGWELLAGSILANLELEKGRLSHPFLDNTMPAIGLFLIYNAIIFFNDEMLYSYITILPILGTMLIIWFCKKGELISDILGSKPFVAVGLISYSLYLWHQPIFAFARIKSMMSSDHQKVGLIVLSIILAILTYFFIEKPMRNAKKVSLKKLVIFLSTFAVILVLPLGYAFKNNGLWGRFKDWQLNVIGFDKTSPNPFTSSYEYVVNSEFISHLNKNFSINDRKRRLLIIGDSFAKDFFNILKEAGLLKGIDVSTHHIPWVCLNTPDIPNINDFISKKDIVQCQNTVRIGNDFLNKYLSQADFIIVASE
ncbi:MAG: acyltransferase family protein [Janthinobacterium lividum]